MHVFFSKNIDQETIENNFYRKVIYSKIGSQVTVQTLNPGEDIPFEKHHSTHQAFKFVRGEGEVVTYNPRKREKKVYVLGEDSFVVVPRNTWHYVKNTSKEERLQFYAIYSNEVHNPNLLEKRQNEIYELDKNKFLFRDKLSGGWIIVDKNRVKVHKRIFKDCSEVFFSQ